MNLTSEQSYEMFTKSGDRACHSLVTKITKKINGKTRVSKEQIVTMVNEGIKKIAEKHAEVNDTEPEGWIVERVSNSLREVGYGFQITRWDL